MGPAFGAYKLKFDKGTDGKLDSLIHTGTGHAGAIPPVVNITQNYCTLSHNYSDKLAVLIYTTDENISHKLSSFFPAGMGPHSCDIGIEGKKLKACEVLAEKKLHDIKLQQRAVRLVAEENMFDATKGASEKRSLAQAREVVKTNKQAKIQAGRVAL